MNKPTSQAIIDHWKFIIDMFIQSILHVKYLVQIPLDR